MSLMVPPQQDVLGSAKEQDVRMESRGHEQLCAGSREEYPTGVQRGLG